MQAGEKKKAETEKVSLQDNDNGMGSLFAGSLEDKLLSLDIMSMTPLEAINELYKLQNEVKGELGKS